jgi:hypothetical protein
MTKKYMQNTLKDYWKEEKEKCILFTNNVQCSHVANLHIMGQPNFRGGASDCLRPHFKKTHSSMQM